MKLLLAKLNLMRVTGLASLAVALLASCGGGDPIEKFVPSRIIVFGDEASLIEADTYTPTNGGRKYTVNGLVRDTDGTTLTATRDCTRNPIWVQVLANDYGYQFAECLTTGLPRAFMQAELNSTAAMVSAAITSYMAGTGFNSGDLVTIMVGTHDVIAAAGQPSHAQAVSAATAAGTAVGADVIRITNRGAKVLAATIHDVGATPYGLASGQAALLTELTSAFNTALITKLQEVSGGGHSAGLVLADETVLVMRRSPSTYGIVNTTAVVCTTAVPNCDESTVDSTAATTHGADWLWASPLMLGANAQARIGSAAVYRARNNPF